MQFQVPQFIDIEDKVIGPFTIRQFLYLAGAGVIIFILYKVLSVTITVILAIPIIVIAAALGFYKPNNQPLMVLIKSFLGFLRKPDFYVWKKTLSKDNQPKLEEDIQLIKKEPIKTKIKPEARLDSARQAKENLQEIGWKVEVEK
jgi:hypothetical protein